LRVVDRAEDQRRDHGVEAVILERESLGIRSNHRGRDPRLLRLPLEPTDHRRRWLGQDQLLQVVRIVGKVEPGPGAEFEYPPSRLPEQCGPSLRHPGALTYPEKRVIDRAEGAFPDFAHRRPSSLAYERDTGFYERGRAPV
jgi:hypothetical protein